MIRKKVKLAYITNGSSRKATYKKRNKGLMKKMSELSTLCGIDACVIMYSPYKSQPEVWPSPKGVQQVLSKFKMIPKMEQRNNMVNQESFLSQRTIKVVEQLKKHCKDNREKEMTQVMFNNICNKWVIHGLNFGDINDLNLLLDEKMSNIDKRMDAFAMTSLYTQEASSSLSSSMVALPPMTMVMPKAMPRTYHNHFP
ncbi:agamous-like MADS-box protein AGL80 [Gossypium australe]|uniref:Agamous-like MADS-box protein AGL80 n=1 Tax=Gossypium australe TaxID=47621 RepID=A0A5B6UJ79_9ROSI|nr:agamous-like MADS-box protein AGL80 [Gossypium australe]